MDPLRDSPLRILDEGSALVLVLDQVDEDDVLVAALVCTIFRDELFKQPRHAVRPADKPYAGKRLVTSVAGVASSARRLAWARTLELQAPAWVRSWSQVPAETWRVSVLWTRCSGRARTVARGMRGSALARHGKGTCRCCSGRARTAAGGPRRPALVRHGKGIWRY